MNPESFTRATMGQSMNQTPKEEEKKWNFFPDGDMYPFDGSNSNSAFSGFGILAWAEVVIQVCKYAFSCNAFRPSTEEFAADPLSDTVLCNIRDNVGSRVFDLGITNRDRGDGDAFHKFVDNFHRSSELDRRHGRYNSYDIYQNEDIYYPIVGVENVIDSQAKELSGFLHRMASDLVTDTARLRMVRAAASMVLDALLGSRPAAIAHEKQALVGNGGGSPKRGVCKAVFLTPVVNAAGEQTFKKTRVLVDFS